MLTILSSRSLGPAREAAPSVLYEAGLYTPDAFHPRGAVLVQDGVIVDVFPEAPADAEQLGVRIALDGILFPGLIDAHNHASFGAIPSWTPARYYTSRFDWRGKSRAGVWVVPEPDPDYARLVSAPFKKIPTVMQPQAFLYGQVRGVVGGTTTMLLDAEVGIPDLPGLPGFVRDPKDWGSRVFGVLDILAVDAVSVNEIVKELNADRAKLMVHLGEGTDGFARGEFRSLVDRQLLTKNTSLIHGMGLLRPDWLKVQQSSASVVWSPVSNLRLYGRTLDIAAVVGLGIPVALAPDWAVSGSSTLLDELRFVRRNYPILGAERLVAMCTEVPAALLGLHHLGRIEKGRAADLLLLGGHRDVTSRFQAADALCHAHVEEVTLVIIAGVSVCGTAELMAKTPAGGLASEIVSVPSTSADYGRTLRIAESAAFGPAATALQGVLGALAPLWEPPVL
ncbi:MAG: amidohydrolase family protein [Myxococcales bacterium]|nr:amidohydrolase family protein [Myxococcales bacterium]